MTNIAICGLGNIGAVHLANLRSLRGCAISGVFDLSAERLERAASQYGVRAFPDLNALLTDANTDAVVIATPSSSHRSILEEALRHGKHVFVEKPIASSLEDAHAMVAASRNSRLKVQVGFCERFNPQFLEARRAVHSGQLGSVRAIYSSRVAPLSLGDPSWELGILDTAVHNLDLILWLIGQRPRTVRAQGVKIYSEPDMLHTAATTLSFSDGAMAVDQITWQRDDPHPLHQCARARMSILGDRGSFEIDLSQRPSSIMTGAAYQQIDSVILGGPEYYGCLKLQFEGFLRAVEDDAPVAAPPVDALWAEEVVIAAAKSLRSGQEMRLEDTPA